MERNYYPTDPYDRRHLQPWHHEAASVSFLASFILATEHNLSSREPGSLDWCRQTNMAYGKTTKIPWLVILPLTEDPWKKHGQLTSLPSIMSNPCRPNSAAAKTQIMKFIEIHHESLNLLEFLCFLCFLFGFLNFLKLPHWPPARTYYAARRSRSRPRCWRAGACGTPSPDGALGWPWDGHGAGH